VSRAGKKQCVEYYAPQIRKIVKKVKFPLDNRHKVWYNTSVPRERNNLIKGRNLIARNGVVTMANTNSSSVRKPTKKQMFEGLLKMEGLSAEQIAFIKHELELLEKKNSGEKKPTATQVANEALKVAIYEGMQDNRLYTVTEVIKEIPAVAGLTNQKVSPLMNQMVESGLLTKTVEKRRSYFKVVRTA